MKNNTLKKLASLGFTIAILLSASLTSCSFHTTNGHSSYKAKKLPPGQAKKISGEKSAKNYAPGHNK